MKHIPRRLFATAILVLLFSGMLTSVSSVAFAQGNEDAPGQIKKAARASALAEETEDEADEEDVKLQRIADRADSDATRDRSTSDGAKADSKAKAESKDDDDDDLVCNPQKPSQCNSFDEDPEPVKTAKATRGPLSCPDYDDGIDDNPYDHDNCDGTIGLHGNGGNGKCAGCTGKADDKWPGGQYPGDHNNGYECDHNGGIGKGNPAHSKCAVEVNRPSRRPSRGHRGPSRPSQPSPAPPIERPSVPNPAPPVQVKGRPPLVVSPALPGIPPPEQPGALPVTGPRDASIFMFIGVLLIGAGSLFVSAESIAARLKRR